MENEQLTRQEEYAWILTGKPAELSGALACDPAVFAQMILAPAMRGVCLLLENDWLFGQESDEASKA